MAYFFDKKEFKFGRDKENELFKKLNDFFKDDLKQSTKTFDCVDYKGNNCDYELKTRRNNYSKYDTTLITTKKLKNIKRPLILIFNFLDGLYYIKYDEKFNEFKKQIIKRNDRNTYVEHTMIPIINLIKID